MPFRIVTLGDSIPWGQGLLENEKFDSLIRDALLPTHPEGVTIQRFAHSGAVIGDHGASGDTAPGEVPESRLSIIEQCDSFTDAPETVDLVLLDGGINDVGVATILNPFALIPPLQSKIESACHRGMRTLLQRVSAKFTKASCRILVTGYYTIFSSRSNPLHLPKLMSIHGIAAPQFMATAEMVNPVVVRCEQFFQQSTASLQAAIADAGDGRITFVPAGFTDDNAIFAPSTFIWGLDDMLNPEDPMAAQRHPQCDAAFPGLFETAHREQCYRASAGHPNVAGASQYAAQIAHFLGV